MRSECIVFVYLPGQTQAVPAGVLSIIQSGRDTTSTFVYGNSYRRRADAVSLDPIDLPLPDVDGQVLRPTRNKYLFGVFRDAAPDAWGRLVINDRYIRHCKTPTKTQANALDLPEIEYLLRSRSDRVGNLDFREKPTDPEPDKKISRVLHLNQLVREAHRIAEHKSARLDVMTLMRPATGMGGARPKTTIEDDGSLWLAKFPMDDDRLPITRIEQAMLDLASRCEITTIEHKLLAVEGLEEPVFMIKRFDRVLSGGNDFVRVGYASALTALGIEEHEQTSASYQDIARHLQRMASPDTQEAQRKEVFRRMVFNILSNNDDDHARNHGVLKLEGGRSELSPVFDIVPRVSIPGVSSVRRLSIRLGKHGRDGTMENILSDTEPFGLSQEEALCEIHFVATQISKHWKKCLEKAGCPPSVVNSLKETLNYSNMVLADLESYEFECEREH